MAPRGRGHIQRNYLGKQSKMNQSDKNEVSVWVRQIDPSLFPGME